MGISNDNEDRPKIRKLPLHLPHLVDANGGPAATAAGRAKMLDHAKREVLEAVLAYLGENKLFADEPTMTEGAMFVEFCVQMDTKKPELPLARVRYELAKLGATHIETIPLDSCITGIDAIGF